METKEQIVSEMRDAFEHVLKEHLAPLEQGLDDLEAKFQKSVQDEGRSGGSSRAVEGKGPLLTLEQKAAPAFRASIPDIEDRELKDVRLGALMLAAAAGQSAVSQLRDVEQKVLNTMTGPAGGYLVPEAIGALFLDSVRPVTRVLQAGARTYAMTEGPIVKLPGWDNSNLVTAQWRNETGNFAASDPTFRQVKLEAKSLATAVTLTVEMLEDAGRDMDAVASLVETEMGRAFGQAVDYAALFGGLTGNQNEPLGVYNTPGTQQVDMGTDGSTPADWDWLLNALYNLESQNFQATGVIWSPRTANTMRKLVTGISGDKTKLTPPPELASLPRLSTNQVPINLVKGASGAVTSPAFVAQWDQMVIGLRPSMSARILRDPYTKASNGEVVLWAYMRADVALLNKQAFCTVLGLKP